MFDTPTLPTSAVTYTHDLGWCLWEINTATGAQERRSDVVLRGYLVVDPGGKQIACADDSGLRIVDGSGQRRVGGDEAWSFAWSPDGASLAYCTSEGIHVLGGGKREGSGDKKHVMSGNAGSPAWSPDGTRVAFSIWDQGVFVTSPNGDCQQLVSGHAVDLDWSPDCAQIVFGIPGEGIACVDVDTGEQRRLTSHPEDGHPVWSPDGAAVAYSRWYPGELRTVRADGTNDILLRAHRVSDVAWSPDSTRVACTSFGRYHSGTALTVVDVSSGRQRLLIGGGSQPVWVDNERIVWLRWMGETIRAVDIEGNRTDLYTHRRANAVRSPSGQHIAYIDQDMPPDARLMVSDRDGRNPWVLTVGETSEPVWLADNRVAWISPDGAHTSTLNGKKQQRFSVDIGWGGCCLIDTEFSPDGTRMAYATRDGAAIVETDGRVEILPGSSPYSTAVWSPDGTRMAYGSTEGLVVVDTSGRDKRVFPWEPSSPYSTAVWSPDGARMAYGSTEGLVVVDTSGRDKRVFPWEPSTGCLVWAPDSAQLVCYTRYDDEKPLLFLCIPSGETRTVRLGTVSEVVWSPDSTHVACPSDEDLVVITVRSGQLHRIVRDEASSDIKWCDQ